MLLLLLIVVVVPENFLPDRVSSLILDLERDDVLPSTFPRVGLGLGLDVQVILVICLHGWCLAA